MKIPFVCCIFPILAMGCVSSPTVSVSYPSEPSTAEQAQILIITPDDASFEGEIYAGSGADVASAVAKSLRRSGFKVKASREQNNINPECILTIDILSL